MTAGGDLFPDGVMLNAYPDSCGGSLGAMVGLLRSEEAFHDAFSMLYILPSLFNSDLDRGFSIIDYGIADAIAAEDDLRHLQALGLELKLDFVLNHISVQSSQFQDLLRNGAKSAFADFFIDWNRFWEGNGEMSPHGYVVPHRDHLDRLFLRKPGLPIMEVPFPDGTRRYYWNTFYQDVTVTPPDAADLQTDLGLSEREAEAVASDITDWVRDGTPIAELDLGAHDDCRSEVIEYVDRNCTRYLGQMDLNAESELVWEYYDRTLQRLRDYGARIVRLDAFAYLHKAVGQSNFFNEPGTWVYLDRVKRLADRYGLVLLPEIHSRYDEATHEKLARNGLAFYDFFFPGLVIDALETGRNDHLVEWIREVVGNRYVTVNMLGCHDGIPLLDLRGLLDEPSIENLVGVVLDRGGIVKNLFGPDGKKITYYQVNATFFSALGEHERKLLLARALQMFMPGVPEVWYLDLFAGANDHEAVRKGGHKEINRTNLSLSEIRSRLREPVVQRQLELLRFRNTFPAFGFDSRLEMDDSDQSKLGLTWTKGGYSATLRTDLVTCEFEITYSDSTGERHLEP